MADYSSARHPGDWVLGGGWTMAAFPGGLPTAADLDAVTGGGPPSCRTGITTAPG